MIIKTSGPNHLNYDPGFIPLPRIASFLVSLVIRCFLHSLQLQSGICHHVQTREKANKNFECLSLIYTRTPIELSKHMSFMPKKDAL